MIYQIASMRRYLIKFLFFACILTGTLPALAQEIPDSYAIQDSLRTDIDIFASEIPGKITLTYDMKEFRKRKNEDKYLKAELIYHLSDSIEDKRHEVRIKARGKNRREVCAFPPIWINIRKSEIDNSNLENIKKIKLVTHCGGLKSYEPYVLKEFLAYKI